MFRKKTRQKRPFVICQDTAAFNWKDVIVGANGLWPKNIFYPRINAQFCVVPWQEADNQINRYPQHATLKSVKLGKISGHHFQNVQHPQWLPDVAFLCISVTDFFLKKFEWRKSFSWVRWYPCGLLVTFALGFKARVNSLACAFYCQKKMADIS